MLKRYPVVVVSSFLFILTSIATGCGAIDSGLLGSKQIEVFRLQLSKQAFNAFRPTPITQRFNLKDYRKQGDENYADGVANASVSVDISPVPLSDPQVASAITQSKLSLKNSMALRVRVNYNVKANYKVFNNRRAGRYTAVADVNNHDFTGMVDTYMFLKGDGPINQRIVKANTISSGDTNMATFSFNEISQQLRVKHQPVRNLGRWLFTDNYTERVVRSSIPVDAPAVFKEQIPLAVQKEVGKQIDAYLATGNNGFAMVLKYLLQDNKLPGSLVLSSDANYGYFSIFMDSTKAQSSSPIPADYVAVNQASKHRGHMSVFVHEHLLSSFFQKNVYTQDYVTENYFVNVFTGSAFNQKYAQEAGTSGLATIKFNQQYPKFVKIENGYLRAHVAANYKLANHLTRLNPECVEDDVLLRINLKLRNHKSALGGDVIVSIPEIDSSSLYASSQSSMDFAQTIKLLEQGNSIDDCKKTLRRSKYTREEVGVAAIPRVGSDLGGIVYTTPRKVFLNSAEMFLEENHDSIMNYIPFGLNPGSDAILQPNSSAENGWLSLHWNIGEQPNKTYLTPEPQPPVEPHQLFQTPGATQQSAEYYSPEQAQQPTFVRPTLPGEVQTTQAEAYPTQPTAEQYYVPQQGSSYPYPGQLPTDYGYGQ